MFFKKYFTKKCRICKGTEGELDQITELDAYNCYTYVFHKECITNVINNPEKYNTSQVDLAIDIATEITSSLKEKSEKEKIRRKKLAELRVYLKEKGM